MILTRLNPKGIHLREAGGIRDIEAAVQGSPFCAQWFGYTNLLVRKRNPQGERREIDLILVTHDRVVMADLKDWGGKVTNSEGMWLHKGQRRGQSASLKIEENAQVLKSLIRSEAGSVRPTPWIEHFVIFTAADADISGLSANDLTNTLPLCDFLSLLTDSHAYEQRFPPGNQWSKVRPLTVGPTAAALKQMFREGGPFLPQEASFAQYEVQGDATHEHRGGVWKEYFAGHRTNLSSSGLLRIWDCDKLPTDYSAVGARRDLLAREQEVLGYLHDADPDFVQDATLPWRARDEEFSMRFWELFELRRTARRMFEFLTASPDMPFERRSELVSLVLSKAAALHRRRVAHRDIGTHSLWIEPESSRVRLSAFGAAHFPGTATVADTRLALLAAGEPLPEDRGMALQGTAFQQDVFLLGVTCWRILIGADVPRTAGIADPTGARTFLEPPIDRWLRKSLDPDPASRFADADEMASSFDITVGRRVAAGLADELRRYRTDIVPFMTWPFVRAVASSRAQIWVSGSGQDAVLVKLWLGFPQNPGQYARALAFLEAAARIKADRPPWTPEVIAAGWGNAGVYLVTTFVQAVPFDEFAEAEADRPEIVMQAGYSFVRGVADMHARNLAHGDLKPSNVLVTGSGTDVHTLLVDIPDMPQEGADSLSTPAYAPSGGGSGPQGRDVYAVAKMIHAALVAVSADPTGGRLDGRLFRAAASMERGFPTLDTLIAEFERPDLVPRPPELRLALGVRDLRNQTELLPDSGSFHVVVNGGATTLSIVGMDQQLRLTLGAGGLPVACAVLDASPATLSWAIANKTLSFEGKVGLFVGNCEKAGVADLLSLPDLQLAIERARSADGGRDPAPIDRDASGAGDSDAPPLGAPLAGSEPTAEPRASARWRAILEAEEEVVPFVVAAGHARRDAVTARHYVDCEEGPEQLDVGPREIVNVSCNGRQIAELDLGRTRGSRLALAKLRSHGIRLGDRLELQSVENRASFTRRQQAVSRVVARAAVLPDLLDYFESGSSVAPSAFRSPKPTDAQLAPYGLNPDQVEAFRHLWAVGPIGLLQGPPGTGKSRFVGAFVHWAVRHGGIGRVLVLSQSHGATNTVAESILKAAAAYRDDLGILRVGQLDRVTDALLPFHPESIQARYRSSFESRERVRFETLGRNLGLPSAYVADLYHLESSVAPIVAAIERRKAELTGRGDVADKAIAARRLSTLMAAYSEILAQFAPGREMEPEQAMQALRQEASTRHSVSNRNAQARMVNAMELGARWLQALSGRQQGMEEFLTRTRSVVCGTCVGIGRPAINIAETEFDLVVIDEAARCDPGELAVGLQSARRVLLVGDHKQLPPLFDRIVARNAALALGMRDTSDTRAVDALAVSDFERSFKSPYGRQVGRTLRRQYRMAPEIRSLVSECFYPEVGLEDGRGMPPQHYDTLPRPMDRQVAWLDTSAEPGGAQDTPDGHSFSNATEVRVTMAVLRGLARQAEFWKHASAAGEWAAGEQAVGVIAMYSAQRRALQSAFDGMAWPDGFAQLVRIDTVDAYQAKENRIVIVSLVRSSPRASRHPLRQRNPLPHSTDYRRVNVALSRAMERLLVVGSADLFRANWPGNSLLPVISHLEERGRILPCAGVAAW
jgi:serine/threonine protein kinase